MREEAIPNGPGDGKCKSLPPPPSFPLKYSLEFKLPPACTPYNPPSWIGKLRKEQLEFCLHFPTKVGKQEQKQKR